MSDRIEHAGVVESVCGDVVRIQIERLSACAGCHAKSMCSIEKKRQVMTLKSDTPLQVGDAVRVVGESSLGMKAVVLAFAVPLVVMVAAMFVAVRMGYGEVVSACAALLSLFVYYIVLFAFRSRLERVFSFRVERI